MINLVVPLPHEGTEMRGKDTAGSRRDGSSAVAKVIGHGLRQGDVESTIGRERPPSRPGRGTRTSTTATRTTTTRTTTTGPARSADGRDEAHAGLSFEELVEAYFDCRRTKRNTASALAFEADLERNLIGLFDELAAGAYRPGPSICFVVTRPKPREVWAAQFRDRVVHHLLYNRIGDRFERAFIVDSCACIKGRGTLYAARRLEAKVRSVTRNWSRRAFYLKVDIANFFVAIDKRVLAAQLEARIPEPWWRELALQILFHDPRQDVILHATPREMALVPPHKRLMEQPAHLGLPIGNLSSQFFANVYLDRLDQLAKHVLRCRHYVRYVDDFIVLHEDRAWLAVVHDEIEAFLPRELGVRLNPAKTIIQPVDRGIDFVGQVVLPWRRFTRRRTFREALKRTAEAPVEGLLQTANSYFGLLGQATASHGDRARLSKVVLAHGRAVARDLRRIA
jgi:RNA-directed DNA polymerase